MTRVQARVPVRIRTSAGEALEGTLRDVSVLGACIESDDPPATGARCHLAFGRDEAGIEIEVWGRVVRLELGAFALEFDQLPYESFERLRTFLLRFAVNPAALEDELTDRLGYLDGLRGEA